MINKSDSCFLVIRFCSSLVLLQTELDSIQSYYQYKLQYISRLDLLHLVDIKTYLSQQVLETTKQNKVKIMWKKSYQICEDKLEPCVVTPC